MVEDEEICSIILRDASIEERAGLLVKLQMTTVEKTILQ